MRASSFAVKAAILTGILCATSAASGADTATSLPVSGQASTTAGATASTATGAPASTKVQTKLATQFSSFAGSKANAQSLVAGLRNGGPITLATPAASGQTSPTVTIDTPTRPMGYGNVTISLALARQQLANQGITQPTPQQIQAALTGGTVTTGSGAAARTVELRGILTMRSSGMGWGNIARSQGMNLGKVVSSTKTAVRPPVAAAASGRGIVTASGAPAISRNGQRFRGRETEDRAEQHFERDEHASFGRTANAGPAARTGSQFAARPETVQPMGRGIVTAAGTSIAATGAAEFGHGRYSSAAVVTAGGEAATVRGHGGEMSHGRH